MIDRMDVNEREFGRVVGLLMKGTVSSAEILQAQIQDGQRDYCSS